LIEDKNTIKSGKMIKKE